ncbi:hypothetical protein ABTE34_21380, partial [Acinetobacter baumannii]
MDAVFVDADDDDVEDPPVVPDAAPDAAPFDPRESVREKPEPLKVTPIEPYCLRSSPPHTGQSV